MQQEVPCKVLIPSPRLPQGPGSLPFLPALPPGAGTEVPAHRLCSFQHRSPEALGCFSRFPCVCVSGCALTFLPGSGSGPWLPWIPNRPPTLQLAGLHWPRPVQPITLPPCGGHLRAWPRVLLGLGCSLHPASARVPALGHLDPTRQLGMVLTIEHPHGVLGALVGKS